MLLSLSFGRRQRTSALHGSILADLSTFEGTSRQPRNDRLRINLNRSALPERLRFARRRESRWILIALVVMAVGCAASVSQDQITRVYGGPQVRALPFAERLAKMLSYSGPLSVWEVDFLFGEGHHIVHGSQIAAALLLPSWQAAQMNKVTINDCPKGQTTGCEQHVMTKTEWQWDSDGHKLFAIALVDPLLGGDRGAQWIFRLYVDDAEVDLHDRHYAALNIENPIGRPETQGSAPPVVDDPFSSAPAEIVALRDSGLLVRLEPATHSAYVNRHLWGALVPERRQAIALDLAQFFLRKAGGTNSVVILDVSSGQKLAAIASEKP